VNGSVVIDAMAPSASGVHFSVARSPDELLTSTPTWYQRRRFSVWSPSPAFVGWVIRRYFDDEDAEEATRVWVALSRRMAAPYQFVLDLRQLQGVSGGAFARVTEFTKTAKPGLDRLAVLVGKQTSGGSIQVGLFTMCQPSFAWRAFTTTPEAAHWLGGGRILEYLAAVEAQGVTHERGRGELDGIVEVLRAAPEASIEAVARKLARSRRSVQRLLEANGTTFSALRASVRVSAAEDLLRDPEAKLDAVAAAIGCADRRTLNRLFKRMTGESPATYRARRNVSQHPSSMSSQVPKEAVPPSRDFSPIL
jgi:AraC-like DNA-binding protein